MGLTIAKSVNKRVGLIILAKSGTNYTKEQRVELKSTKSGTKSGIENGMLCFLLPDVFWEILLVKKTGNLLFNCESSSSTIYQINLSVCLCVCVQS